MDWTGLDLQIELKTDFLEVNGQSLAMLERHLFF